MDYVDFFKDDLIDSMVRIDFQYLLEVRDRVIVTISVEHLRLLNLIHEAAVSVGISNDHARLSGQSVRDNNVVDLLE
jgi:hypothetical protein